MKKKKKKLPMSLSVLIIGFLISTSSLNIVSTQALLEGENNQFNTDYFDRSDWEWSTTEIISTESTQHSMYGCLVTDFSGIVHMVWHDKTDYLGAGDDYDIFYKRWDIATTSWTTTELISTESTADSLDPTLDIDTSGNIHISWHDRTNYAGSGIESDIFYKRWDTTTTSWTTTEVVSTESTSDSGMQSLAVDILGNVHVAWMDHTDYLGSGADTDIFYKYWNISTSTWNTTEVVSTESTYASEYPDLITDSVGNIHIVWTDYTNYLGAGNDWDIFYKRWDSAISSWTSTEIVSTDSTEDSESSSLTVDDAGNVHIAWQDETDYDGSGIDFDIFYKLWNLENSTLTTTEVISIESTADSLRPDLRADISGNIHLSWDDNSNYLGSGTDWDIFYKRQNTVTSSWSTTEVISTESSEDSWEVSMDVDFLGNVYLIWHDVTNFEGCGTDYDIFFKQLSGPIAAPILALIAPNPTESNMIYLDWSDIFGATDYIVYRSNSFIWSIDGLVPIAVVSTSEYIDTVLSGGSYFYVIVASNELWNSSLSNCQYVEVIFSALDSPELAPILPNPTDSDSVSLAWNNVNSATDYHVYRSTSYIWTVEGLVPITTISSSDYIDTVPSEGYYFYVIVANDGTINSSLSNCEYVEVIFPALDSPELAPILPNPTDSDSISLVWDSIDGANEYYVYRSVSFIWSVEVLTPIATVGSTSYIDSLPSEGYYFYVIVANDGARNSTHSNCEYVEYKVAHLREFTLVSGLILAAFALVFVVTRIRKKNFKLN